MIKCNFCGKEFEPSAYKKRQFNKGIPVYCSKGCATSFRYKDKLEITDELISKIRNMFETTELSYDEIQKLSGLSKNRFTEMVKENDIKRDVNVSNALRYKHMKCTMENEYGISNAMENQQFINKIKNTKKEKYGNANFNNIDKILKTKKSRYDSATYNNSEQTKQTNLQNIGVSTHLITDSVKQKRKQSSIEKYGVDNPFKSNVIHKKALNTIKEKYGVNSALLVPEVQEKIKNTMLEKYGVDNIMKTDKYKKKMVETMLDRYNVVSGFLTENAINSHKQGTKSKINNEFAKALSNITSKQIIQEKALTKFIYDIQIDDNLLIDINPTVSHNTYISYPFRLGLVDENKPVSKDYHLERLLNAKQHNYNLISIFDWDNAIKIEYMLQDKETLYARNLELKEIPKKDTDEFLNKYHLQNTCQGQEVRLGLYKDDELIEVMTFGMPRYNKNYEWELLRLCTKAEYKVVGGAEKLFKHFVEIYKPNSVISYCDFSKFSGEVYTRLGFKQRGKPKPSKHWSKGSEHITDNLLRQRGYDQLFNANYGKGTSNEELMLENGWLPIYDCGQATYIWNK